MISWPGAILLQGAKPGMALVEHGIVSLPIPVEAPEIGSNLTVQLLNQRIWT